MPKTGSAYVYSYVTVGEFLAFIIGWNLILEYVIGTASVARGWTAYCDSLTGGRLRHFLHSTVPIDVPGLSPYADFVAFALTLTLTGKHTCCCVMIGSLNGLFVSYTSFARLLYSWKQ